MRFALLGFALFAGPARSEQPFQPLFNGKDLTGWSGFMKDPKADYTKSFLIEDGLLKVTGKPNGYLATQASHGDYELRLKWCWPAGSKGGNSGVLFHIGKVDKYWPKSLEAQLKHEQAGELWLTDEPKIEVPEERRAPALPKRRILRLKGDDFEKPIGEWNQLSLTCDGDTVKIVVNGKLANEAKKSELTKGRIAIQSEGAEVHFKDVEIRPLK